jgi:hypothetical protein
MDPYSCHPKILHLLNNNFLLSPKIWTNSSKWWWCNNINSNSKCSKLPCLKTLILTLTIKILWCFNKTISCHKLIQVYLLNSNSSNFTLLWMRWFSSNSILNKFPLICLEVIKLAWSPTNSACFKIPSIDRWWREWEECLVCKAVVGTLALTTNSPFFPKMAN